MKKKSKECFKCHTIVDKFHTPFYDKKGKELIVCNKCWNEFARRRIMPSEPTQ